MQTLFKDTESPPAPPVSYGPPRVVVSDIDMPLWSMVAFMLKWALASIPALLVIGVVLGAIGAVAVVVAGALGITR